MIGGRRRAQGGAGSEEGAREGRALAQAARTPGSTGAAPLAPPTSASSRKIRRKEFLQKRKEEKRRPAATAVGAAAASAGRSALGPASDEAAAADRVDEVAFNEIYHAPPELGKGSRRARSSVASEGGRHARAFERLMGRGDAPNLADADEREALRQHLIDSYRKKRGGGLFDRHRSKKR